MKHVTIALVAIAIAIAGCATQPYRPLVDMQGRSPEQYNADVAACQKYAQESNVAAELAAGAIAGALIGALLGGASRGNTGNWARTGAVAGGLGGAGHGYNQQQVIVQRCMAGRGWNVLR